MNDYAKAFNSLAEMLAESAQLAETADEAFTAVYFDDDEDGLAAAEDVLGAEE